MIVVTGASGFIGSAMVQRLNEEGRGFDLIVVDDFYKHYKDRNLYRKIIREWIHRDIFINWFENHFDTVEAVIHLGARTDTSEQDSAIFDKLNVEYSKALWKVCAAQDIPFIYASSAAVYGGGEHGFDDNIDPNKLKPLNPYGRSKLSFDQWALSQKEQPTKWFGLRFFNVYGPNEYHKGRMASVVYHASQQIRSTGSMKLFRSHRQGVEDGEQQRDFIYVKDVVGIISELLKKNTVNSGIYNLGTGEARTFNDLVGTIFSVLGKPQKISFIDTPEDIRESYQYFTEANMSKLKDAGLDYAFHSLELGVKDYVSNYLMEGNKHL